MDKDNDFCKWDHVVEINKSGYYRDHYIRFKISCSKVFITLNVEAIIEEIEKKKKEFFTYDINGMPLNYEYNRRKLFCLHCGRKVMGKYWDDK